MNSVLDDTLHCTCQRCNHRWCPDIVRQLLDAGVEAAQVRKVVEAAPPKRCAACKSAYYDRPYAHNSHLGATSDE